MTKKTNLMIRYAQPNAHLASRRHARLVRYQSAAGAEDDYFRYANRGR